MPGTLHGDITAQGCSGFQGLRSYNLEFRILLHLWNLWCKVGLRRPVSQARKPMIYTSGKAVRLDAGPKNYKVQLAISSNMPSFIHPEICKPKPRINSKPQNPQHPRPPPPTNKQTTSSEKGRCSFLVGNSGHLHGTAGGNQSQALQASVRAAKHV